jgi:hypothetical protein
MVGGEHSTENDSMRFCSTLCGCYCYLHPIGDAYRHARIAHGINDAAQLGSDRSSTASRPRSLLQIFFREGIGWNIRPGSARPSFEDATGYVSGARVTGRDISRQLGLPYIWTDGIDMARSRVAAHGSEVVEGSSFSSWVAQAGSRCVLRVRHFRMGCDRLAIQRSLPRVESYSPATRSRMLHSPRRGSL